MNHHITSTSGIQFPTETSSLLSRSNSHLGQLDGVDLEILHQHPVSGSIFRNGSVRGYFAVRETHSITLHQLLLQVREGSYSYLFLVMDFKVILYSQGQHLSRS